MKLAAFIAVGIFVTFGMFGGFADLVKQTSTLPNAENFFSISKEPGAYANWGFQIFVSMMAMMMASEPGTSELRLSSSAL